MQTTSTATILISYAGDSEPAPFTTSTATAYTRQQDGEEFERLRRDYVFRVR